MFPELREWVANVKSAHIKYPGIVFEIGSRDINGGVRDLFHDAFGYTGIDMIGGPGVDVIGHAAEVLRSRGSRSIQVDTFIILETLEHDRRFWQTMREVDQTHRKDGYLLISAPTLGMGYHGYPRDYWRFTEDAFRDVLFDGYEILDLTIFDKPHCIAAIGRRL